MEAGEVRWALGCGVSVVAAAVYAVAGTALDINVVDDAKHSCLGGLSAEEGSATFWVLGRIALFPIVSVASVICSLSLNLLAFLPKLVGRWWATPLLALLAVLVSAAGPAALIVYDVATEGTPGDCVLPWWPSWLPT
ncbi:hypothetical protein GCM10017600_87190 [Streptosporangium carneum]|uniref:Uncharacterized protein n=1 Tax=Streptosporangium carneum TaxID=47481 RepID=A0A9W6IC31_9ACTN|nr:hypothetical protein GCM10017600_87190 [Streptosporangium carneum]